MNENTQKMRELLTKFNLRVDSLSNTFDNESLVMILDACKHLKVILDYEFDMVSSLIVKSMIMDDIRNLATNVKVIIATIKLKGLNFGGFSLN